MLRTIAPFGVRAKVRFTLGLLLTTLLLGGCRSRPAEVSEGQISRTQEESRSGPDAAKTKTPSAALRPQKDAEAMRKETQDFGMIGIIEDRSATGPKNGGTPALSPAPSPAPRPRPASAPQLRAGSASVIELGDVSAAGQGLAHGMSARQGFASGHGRLMGSHKTVSAPRWNTESYAHQPENDFVRAQEQPLSTFAADVDTASYSNVRRFLKEGSLPPASAVRIEEMLNYFDYEYPAPAAGAPFGVYTEVTEAPWKKEHRLVHVGIKTPEISQEKVPARNLVFLLDVSGSMQSPDKLPLLQRSMDLLVRNLRENDSVSIVVYAGASGVVLPPTSGENQSHILSALGRLSAGGSTNGAAGITEAYSLAHRMFKKNGINRVILATDGDFNVGTTSEGELVKLIEKERRGGVFLTVLGFGRGNLKDSTMEMLADKGNGNYAYIDSLSEARKVLVEEGGATLVTVAKDVKFQVEFNPAVVESYRLVGYENRKLNAQDFNDDTKDAGEMGAGHSVTALYEVVPVGTASPASSTDPLKYQNEPARPRATGELATVKLRYKTPQGTTSSKLEYIVRNQVKPFGSADAEHRFAASVAEFGLVLRRSEHASSATLKSARARAEAALGSSPDKNRAEFVQLIRAAEKLQSRAPQASRGD